MNILRGHARKQKSFVFCCAKIKSDMKTKFYTLIIWQSYFDIFKQSKKSLLHFMFCFMYNLYVNPNVNPNVNLKI